MPLQVPDYCPRGRTDCKPLAQIVSDPEYGPQTFICVGENDGTGRAVEQDCYRQCHKTNDGVDWMANCDLRDLTDHATVILEAMSVIQNEKAMEGESDEA